MALREVPIYDDEESVIKSTIAVVCQARNVKAWGTVLWSNDAAFVVNLPDENKHFTIIKYRKARRFGAESEIWLANVRAFDPILDDGEDLGYVVSPGPADVTLAAFAVVLIPEERSADFKTLEEALEGAEAG